MKPERMETRPLPASRDHTLITGHLLLPIAGGLELVPGTLTVRSGVVEQVEAGRSGAHADLGSNDHVIFPGFIDAHVHLPQFDSIGVDGLELLQWLDRVIFPAEARWADVAYASAMAARVARQLIAVGTTGVGAYATVHPESSQAALDQLAAHGLCGHVGQVLMDQNAPPELCLAADEALDSAANQRANGRIRPAVTPRFALSCSPALLRGAAELASSTGWAIQTHCAETRAECARVAAIHEGRSYVDVYRRAGLLTPRSLLAHAIWLDDKDRRVLAETGAIATHCPTANRFLNAGVFDRERATRQGVRVAAGSDIAGGPDRSMVRVARAMIDAAKQAGATVVARPSAADCWWQITAGNAQALGLTDVGVLAPGMCADLVIARPDIPWTESPNPLSTLLYAWDDRWIEHVLVQGRPGYTAPVGVASPAI